MNLYFDDFVTQAPKIYLFKTNFVTLKLIGIAGVRINDYGVAIRKTWKIIVGLLKKARLYPVASKSYKLVGSLQGHH